MARSLGFHVRGAAPLAPDIRDIESIKLGARNRMMRKTPRVTGKTIRKIRSFVRVWLRKNLTPLSADVDNSFETFLAQTNYPEWRKNELRLAMEKDIPNFKNSSFNKREFYDEPKFNRWINSRSDWFKGKTGPNFKLIEHELFQLPDFIKTVPVCDRAKYIHERLYRPGARYQATDHSSFEAHIVSRIMRVVEFQLYKYMTKNLPNHEWFMDLLHKSILGNQECYLRCKNGFCNVTTEARMSGDMCTSLGNGFTNLIIMKFLAYQAGWPQCVGVVEGDDGLFRIEGDEIDVSAFEQVGFTVKSNCTTELHSAGFCQLYYSDDAYENLVDPIKVILRAGWTMTSSMHGGLKIMQGLTRAKALSMLCEAPTNPITSKMALWLLRATRKVSPRFDYADNDRWWSEQVLSTNVGKCVQKAEIGPTPGQREQAHKLWGISPHEQIALETYFDGLDVIGPIDHPIILDHVSPWAIWSWHNLTELHDEKTSWRS